MKMYIASKFENGARAAELAGLLELRGYTITRKWWEDEPFSITDRAKSASIAEKDLQGVRDADALIFIDEEDLDYRGSWAEVGAALALGKTVYVLGNNHEKAVFGFHPLVRAMRWPV